MNNEFKDYYEILGVRPDASLHNIQVARQRELSQNWSNPMGRLQIEEAFRVLSNPESRRQYNIEFNEHISERERAIRNATTSTEMENAISAYPFKPTEQAQSEEKMELPIEKDQSKDKKALDNDISEKNINLEKIQQEIEKVTDEVKEEEQNSVTSEDESTREQIEEEEKGEQPLYGKIERNFELVPKFELSTIKDVKTEETKLIEKYEEELIEQIYQLLSEPTNNYNNYNIEIARLKYENQIKLLEARMKMKEKQQIPKHGYVEYWLSFLALKFKLSRSQKKLANLNEYISNHNNQTKKAGQKDNSSLSKIYNKLDNKQQQIVKLNENLKKTERNLEEEKEKREKKQSNIFAVKNLEIKQARALEKRDKAVEKRDEVLEKRGKIANKMVLHRNGIVRGAQVIIAYDIAKTKIQNFVDKFRQEFDSENNIEKKRSK